MEVMPRGISWCLIVSVYCSLAKERLWAEHLTSLPKWGVGTLECFRERAPMSDSMPLKQIIGQTITYNGTTSGFEVKS